MDENASRPSRAALFVDDNKLVLQTVRHLLGDSPWRVLTAGDAFEGLCMLVEKRPRVVFIDADSARLDGFQFCMLVKNHPLFSSTRVVLVLEAGDAVERARAGAAGAEGVLVKPFGGQELQRLIAGGEDKAA